MSETTEKVKDAVDTTADKLKGIAKKIGGAVHDAADATTEKLKEVGKDIKDAGKDVKKDVKKDLDS